MDRRIIPREHIRNSVFRSVFFQSNVGNLRAQMNLQASLKNSTTFVESMDFYKYHKTQTDFNATNESITTLNWNSSGEYLISSAFGRMITISNPHTERVLLEYQSRHNPYIIQLDFMPHSQDREIISCSQDGKIVHTRFLEEYSNNRYNNPRRYSYSAEFNNLVDGTFLCHMKPTYVCTLPNEPRCFITGGMDGTIRFIDLRMRSECLLYPCNLNVLVVCPHDVNSFDVAPISHYQIAVGCSDSIVNIYDRRKLPIINSIDPSFPRVGNLTLPLQSFTVANPKGINFLRFSPDENELLACFESNRTYLIDLKHNNFEGIKTLASGYEYNIRPIYSLVNQNDESVSSPNNVLPYCDPYVQEELTTPRRRDGSHAGTHVARSQNSQYHIQQRDPQENYTVLRRGRRTVLIYPPTLEPSPTELNEDNYVRMAFRQHETTPNMPQQAAFWGDKHVLNGSRTGFVYICDRFNGNLVKTLQAKDDVANPNALDTYWKEFNYVQSIAVHPTMPYFATSVRRNYSIKLFGPMNLNASHNNDAAAAAAAAAAE